MHLYILFPIWKVHLSHICPSQLKNACLLHMFQMTSPSFGKQALISSAESAMLSLGFSTYQNQGPMKQLGVEHTQGSGFNPQHHLREKKSKKKKPTKTLTIDPYTFQGFLACYLIIPAFWEQGCVLGSVYNTGMVAVESLTCRASHRGMSKENGTEPLNTSSSLCWKAYTPA